MRFFLTLLVLAVIFSLPLQSDPVAFQVSSPAVKTALSDVVNQQITAFQKGDFATAYTFSSREIQAKYDASTFERMVKTGFANLTRSNSISFGPALDDGENGVIYVHVTDAQGKQLYLYSFKHEEAGWRVTGVSRQVEEYPQVQPPSPATPAPTPTPAPGTPGSSII